MFLPDLGKYLPTLHGITSEKTVIFKEQIGIHSFLIGPVTALLSKSLPVHNL
jgi:hypothetical protein